MRDGLENLRDRIDELNAASVRELDAADDKIKQVSRFPFGRLIGKLITRNNIESANRTSSLADELMEIAKNHKN